MASDEIENVLILQGGGSLGAFACGVFKALVKNDIKIDIVAGTSIGGANASIIASSKEDNPENALEQFWLELAEGDINSNSYPFMNWSLYGLTNSLTSVADYTRNIHGSEIKSISSFYKSAFFGNKKVFIPRWNPQYALSDPEYFNPNKWTYLYDHSPLIKTLEKYVDFNKLQPNGNPNSRLIITAVNVLTAEPLAFDSSKQQITPKHLLATTAYPKYYFQWVEVEEGVYAWDGSLLSNTPLREVIDASPIKNKRIFLVENYPKNIDNLPANLFEVEHRTRDILFSDKTMHNIKMSKAFTVYLKLINDLYNMLENNFNSQNKEDIRNFERIRKRYKRISENHGAEIKKTYYITREEKDSNLYENAEFSVEVIKNSIKDGELQTNKVINQMSKE
ncbi:MAG: patatin-like phospholipase family protein [Nitrososphaeraceae archaeon]|jgi:NTE family protein|nr:patatin-like phospholipase family protein [Nitrososphaeraceae archaeon]